MRRRVQLTATELRMAAVAAADHEEFGVTSGMHHIAGAAAGNGLGNHHLGCVGELVVAKDLNVYSRIGTPANDHLTGDVGRLQIRATAGARLIIRPGDTQEVPQLLVIGSWPEYVIVGWMLPSEARALGDWEEYGNRPGAWFVRQSLLHDLDELTEWGGTQ